jgi:hypothetical protein
MKKLTLALFILISISAVAQQTKQETTFKRFQLGANISPDFCFRTLKNTDKNLSYIADLIWLRNDIERPKIGYSGGINFCYQLTKFMGIETGIQYSNKGYKTRNRTLIWDGSLPEVPDRIKSIYNYHYIDIPLKVNFSLGKNKVRFFSSLGIVGNVFIDEIQKNIFVYSNRKEIDNFSTNYDYHRFNVSASISAGIDYKLSNNSSLRIEPTFRHGLSQIIDAPATAYLYSAGLNIGYYYGL